MRQHLHRQSQPRSPPTRCHPHRRPCSDRPQAARGTGHVATVRPSHPLTRCRASLPRAAWAPGALRLRRLCVSALAVVTPACRPARTFRSVRAQQRRHGHLLACARCTRGVHHPMRVLRAAAPSTVPSAFHASTLVRQCPAFPPDRVRSLPAAGPYKSSNMAVSSDGSALPCRMPGVRRSIPADDSRPNLGTFRFSGSRRSTRSVPRPPVT